MSRFGVVLAVVLLSAGVAYGQGQVHPLSGRPAQSTTIDVTIQISDAI